MHKSNRRNGTAREHNDATNPKDNRFCPTMNDSPTRTCDAKVAAQRYARSEVPKWSDYRSGGRNSQGNISVLGNQGGNDPSASPTRIFKLRWCACQVGNGGVTILRGRCSRWGHVVDDNNEAPNGRQRRAEVRV
jgi:hypothetical protein